MSYVQKLEAYLAEQKAAGNPIRFGSMKKDDPIREYLVSLFAPEGFFPGSGVVGDELRAQYATDPEKAMERLAEIFLKLSNGEYKSHRMTTEELAALSGELAALDGELAATVTYELGTNDKGQPFIRCLVCKMCSYHPEDIRQRYCGKCHQYHPVKEADVQTSPA